MGSSIASVVAGVVSRLSSFLFITEYPLCSLNLIIIIIAWLGWFADFFLFYNKHILIILIINFFLYFVIMPFF